MSLKIVTGGTTGAADGTLVSSGNKIVIGALNTPVDVHLRVDDDTYTTDEALTLPAELEVSFNGGSTWKGIADNPIPLVTGVGLGSTDLGDLNFPIKVRQIINAGSSAGSFTSDGTFTNCTALADVTGFAAAVNTASLDLSWGAVANRTRYQVDRATNAGFTTGVTLGVYTGTGTSFTDTGLTNGTTYYYRIKAVGSYRYKDSANFATANGTPAAITTYTASVSSDGMARAYDAGTATWANRRALSPGTDAYPTLDYCHGGYSNNPATTDRQIARTHVHLDTSAIPDGATIVAARLKLWGHETFTKASMNSSTVMVLVESLMTAAATVATTDYPLAKFGTTELTDTRMTHAAWTDGAYNVITLNAAGRAIVNKTGHTRLGLMEASDFDNSAPASGATARSLYFYASEYATSGKRPVLEVDYI